MKRLVVGIIAAGFLVSMARTAMAQTKTVRSRDENGDGHRRGDRSLDAARSRSRNRTAPSCQIVAGPDIQRFAEVKVGDKVNARYYENVVVRLKRPGEPEVDSTTKGTTGSEQALPGGTKARQLTITATIAAIDMNTPAVTFTGPNGGKIRQSAGPGGSRQGEGRRQGRHRLDRSGAGVARARPVRASFRPGRSAVIAPGAPGDSLVPTRQSRGANRRQQRSALCSQALCGVYRHVLARSRRLRQRGPRGRLSRRRNRIARGVTGVRSHGADGGVRARPDLGRSLQPRCLRRLVGGRPLSRRRCCCLTPWRKSSVASAAHACCTSSRAAARISASPPGSPPTATACTHRAGIRLRRGSCAKS